MEVLLYRLSITIFRQSLRFYHLTKWKCLENWILFAVVNGFKLKCKKQKNYHKYYHKWFVKASLWNKTYNQRSKSNKSLQWNWVIKCVSSGFVLIFLWCMMQLSMGKMSNDLINECVIRTSSVFGKLAVGR
jgi:hypothetical protein